MGLTRKLLSVSTLGAVDFRSDKERTARHTAKGARHSVKVSKEAAKQTKLLEEQTELLREQARIQKATPFQQASDRGVLPPPRPD